MTIDKLKEYLKQGREIEMSIKDKAYFLSYIPNKQNDNGDLEMQFYIYDCAMKLDVFEGTLQEIFEYPFLQGVCLDSSIEQFSFDYIL